MGLILLSCFLLSASFAGYGLLFKKIFLRQGDQGFYTFGDVGLLGGALLMLVAGSVQVFVPLNQADAILVLLGLPFLALFRQGLFSDSDKRKIGLVLVSFAVTLCACAVLSVVSKREIYYDTGLYHLQFILNLQESPFIVGLGNIHQRFGYNSLLFPLAAVGGMKPLGLAGVFSCNMVFFSFFMAAILQRLAMGLCEKRWKSAVFGGALLTFCLMTPTVWKLIGSPNTDLSTTLLVLYIFYLFVDWVSLLPSTVEKSGPVTDAALGLSVVLTGMVLGIKIANLMIALVPLFMWGTADQPWQRMKHLLSGAGLFAILFLALWLGRGFMTSGCLAFPIAASCVDGLPWSVGVDVAIDDANWMKSWARTPAVDPSIVLASWDWLGGWFARLAHDLVVWSIGGLYGLVLMAALVRGVARKTGSAIFAYTSQQNRLMAGVIAISVAGYVFWFMTSPLVRYGVPFLASLPLLLLAVVFPYGWVQSLQTPRLRGVAMWVLARDSRVFGVVMGGWSACMGAALIMLFGFVSVQHLWGASWPQLPTPALETWQTKQGVTLYSPQTGDQCWGAPRPCTPKKNPDLVFETWKGWPLVKRHP